MFFNLFFIFSNFYLVDLHTQKFVALANLRQRIIKNHFIICKLFFNFNPWKQLVTIFPKRQVSQTPYLYNRVSLIWASKYSTLHTNAQEMLNLMTFNNVLKWCETRPIWPIIACGLLFHPFQASIYIIRPFWAHTRIILLLVYLNTFLILLIKTFLA